MQGSYPHQPGPAAVTELGTEPEQSLLMVRQGHEVRCAQGKQPLENIAKDFSFSRVPVANKMSDLIPPYLPKKPRKRDCIKSEETGEFHWPGRDGGSAE